MGFTNITPGFTGLHSSSLSLCHSFVCCFSECSFLLCITFYFVAFSEKTRSLLNVPLSPFALTLGWNWSKDIDGTEVFSAGLVEAFPHFSLLDKHPCSTWNAFGFTLRTAAIFLPLITSGLDALARYVPRPMDDPQGKSNGNQPCLTLRRYFVGTRLGERVREREKENRTAKQFSVCVPENSFSAKSMHWLCLFQR